MVPFLFAFLSTIIVSAIALHYRYWRVPSAYAAIPHLKPEFGVGSIRQMGLMDGKSIAQAFMTIHSKLGSPPMHQLWLGTHHFIVLHSPELMREVFMNHRTYHGCTPFLDAATRAFFKEGSIINFDGPMHRKLSGIIVPLFKQQRLQSWLPVIMHKVNLMVDIWQQRLELLRTSNKNVHVLENHSQIERDLELFVNDVVAFMVLGSDQRSVDEELIAAHEATQLPLPPELHQLQQSSAQRLRCRELHSAVMTVQREFGRTVTSPLSPRVLKFILALNYPLYRARQTLANHVRESMERCVGMAASDENGDFAPASSTNDGPSLFQLSALFGYAKAVERASVTEAMALDNLAGLLAAAGETSIATLAWLTYYLQRNPTVQQRCRDELYAANLIPETSAGTLPEIDWETMKSLTYCDAVVRETFRLGVQTAGAFRVTAEPTTLGGVQLPKGQQIWWVSTCAHRDQANWNEGPTIFEPARFVDQLPPPHRNDSSYSPGVDITASCSDVNIGSDVDQVTRESPAFIPFGNGAHGCPGRYFGWLLVKSFLVRSMQRGVLFGLPKDQSHIVSADTDAHRSNVSIFPVNLKPDISFQQQ